MWGWGLFETKETITEDCEKWGWGKAVIQYIRDMHEFVNE